MICIGSLFEESPHAMVGTFKTANRTSKQRLMVREEEIYITRSAALWARRREVPPWTGCRRFKVAMSYLRALSVDAAAAAAAFAFAFFGEMAGL
jgi:hypothetical protein